MIDHYSRDKLDPHASGPNQRLNTLGRPHKRSSVGMPKRWDGPEDVVGNDVGCPTCWDTKRMLHDGVQSENVLSYMLSSTDVAFQI